jgi:hypothetical protein
MTFACGPRNGHTPPHAGKVNLDVDVSSGPGVDVGKPVNVATDDGADPRASGFGME